VAQQKNDHYKMMDVKKEATDREIKKVYHKLSIWNGEAGEHMIGDLRVDIDGLLPRSNMRDCKLGVNWECMNSDWKVTDHLKRVNGVTCGQPLSDGVDTDTQFNCPWGVVVDGEGNFIVTDYINHRVMVRTTSLSQTGTIIYPLEWLCSSVMEMVSYY
jgi:hypothetical protein